MTSYSLLSDVNRLTSRPPNIVWSVTAMSRAGTPRSSARSRSRLTTSSGRVTRRSVSTFTNPGMARARLTSASIPFAKVSKSR
jgi:hypothetical protein